MAGPEAAARPAASAATPAAGFAAFLGGLGSWFGALGMQQVLLAWLVVGELRESDQWVGVAQTSTSLAGLLLLPLGGALGDRLEALGLLVRLHLAATLPVLALAALVLTGALRLPLLIAAGLAMGGINALAGPARDSLLSEVAGGDVMRAVTTATIVQFGSQGLGMLAAGSARWLGLPGVLGAQAACVALGALVCLRLPRAPATAAPPTRRPSFAELASGLRIVLASELRVVLAMVTGVGLLFGGSYGVVLPLLVRDVYGGQVGQVSLLLAMFPVGTIAGSAVLLARGGIRRKGRGLALALAAGALVLVAASRGVPFPWLVALIGAWGLAGAVFMNVSRTLFQERAPRAERARVLAVNQLGFMAAAPVGSLLAGFVSGAVGPLGALAWLGGAMLALVAVAAATSALLRLE